MQKEITALENLIGNNACKDISEDIWLFFTRHAPIINVDLLIKNEKEEILLSWRKDKDFESGWHFPGGVIRFKETFEKRLQLVAQNEIGTQIEFNKVPLEINQIILNQKNRSHFISFLYRCYLPNNFIIKNEKKDENSPGYLKWFQKCPKNLLKCHYIYKKYFHENIYNWRKWIYRKKFSRIF